MIKEIIIPKEVQYLIEIQKNKKLKNRIVNVYDALVYKKGKTKNFFDMRPDIVIQYPDDRKVLIDSKVSMNAYVRYMEASGPEQQKKDIKNHITAVKSHINLLSKKGYDDHGKTLDFVMMFMPNEPAFMLTLKEDPNIWHYAYEKRILLISPTNLITALKLIEDLWKRERQSQNTQEIVTRGSLLYDKFVNFSESLLNVGDKLGEATKSYDKAYKQLRSGPGDLIGQVEKLKKLGLKPKKTMPDILLDKNQSE